MHSRKTITIVTSPATSTKSLPSYGSLTSPTTRQGPIYRVEERSRTIYVASDVDPSQWDTHSLNAIFTLAEAPEVDHCEQEGSVEQPIRRTHSSVDTQVIIAAEASDHSDESRVSSPRVSVYHSRRPGVKSASAVLNSRTTVFSPEIPRRGSPSRPTARQRILFYHKHDPYYGFTNFSPHPVIYKGKKYPTSEHLFQSFKVSHLFLTFWSNIYDFSQFQNHRPNLAEHIRTCSERPSVAFSEARRFQPEVRPDWKQVNIEKVSYHFTIQVSVTENESRWTKRYSTNLPNTAIFKLNSSGQEMRN